MVEFLDALKHEFQVPFENLVLEFAIILFIILVSPLILRRLHVPGIIVLILSGVLIGPHGLNWVEKSAAIDLFSTIGLLYIMFLLGVELDLREYQKNRYRSIVFGFFTFTIPLTIGFFACRNLLGYSIETSLIIGSMLSTHTLIAYPIVSRLGLTKSQTVAVTVGGTILTDTAVLVLLAVISGYVKEGLEVAMLVRLAISFTLYLLFMFFVVTWISRQVFKRFENESYSQFIYVLCIVFLSAFLADLAGLEPIIGAFVAGFTLNRLIPHTSPLMNRLGFVGNALFIPFFLISVGMMVDLKVTLHGTQTLIVSGILIVAALFSKWLAASVTSLIFRYKTYQRRLMFGLSSSHALAILAVLIVGTELGIIDHALQDAAILIILVSCAVASFVTEHAGKQALIESPERVAEEEESEPERVMIPLSNPESYTKLLDLAMTLKSGRDSLPLLAVSVVEDSEKVQEKLSAARDLLEQAAQYASGAGQNIDIIATIDQNTISGIKRITKESAVTDTVLGIPGRSSVADIIFGRIVEQIISSTDNTIFLYHCVRPINLNRRIHLACPQYSEREYGFTHWVDKVMRISSTLNLKIIVHSHNETFKAIQRYFNIHKQGKVLSWVEVRDFRNLTPLTSMVGEDDLLLFIRPRRGSLSYSASLDHIGFALMRESKELGFLLVYPCVPVDKDFMYTPEEFDSSALNQGLQQLQRRTSRLRRFFRLKQIDN